jgi:hypothetical protein
VGTRVDRGRDRGDGTRRGLVGALLPFSCCCRSWMAWPAGPGISAAG